ncbi:unnamed protein product, partial [Mesorhabditis belari]|uniref:Macrophage migration inhibitory factor n=1 Tax=Mesorhabditis belari TaxID=2138241 RepID=A0AAF3F191_9BILA
MPVLRVVTSLASRQVPPDFETGLPKVIAAIMNKDLSRFWLELTTDARLTLGGSSEPAACVFVKSIGCVSAAETPNLTEKITAFCEEKLQLPKDRIGIQFFDLDPNLIARGGLTVAEKSKQ